MSEGLNRDVVRMLGRHERALERLESIERVTTGTPADITALDGRIDILETYQMPTSDDNVASPPTLVQITAAFGAPAVAGDGFIGFIDDAGAGAAVWLCSSDGTNWWYVAMTKAT